MKKGSKMSAESRAKMSAQRKGRRAYDITPEIRERMSLAQKGRPSSFLGKHHTEEAKKKLSLANIGHKHSEESRLKMSLSKKGKPSHRKGKKMSPEALAKRRLKTSMWGSNNPNWRGGSTTESQRIKSSSRYLGWRQEVFIKDAFTCQKCGDKSGGNLNAHHLKRFSALLAEAREYMPLFTMYDAAMAYSPMWNVGNGLTLCEKCHIEIHRGK